MFRCFLRCCSPQIPFPSLSCTFMFCCSWRGLQRTLNFGDVWCVINSWSSSETNLRHLRSQEAENMEQEHAQGCGAALGRTRNASAWVWGGIKKYLSPGLDTVCPGWGHPWAQKVGRCPHLAFLGTWNNGTKQGTETEGTEKRTETFPHWISRKPGLLKAEFRTWNLQPHTFASLLWERQMDFLQVLAIVNWNSAF